MAHAWGVDYIEPDLVMTKDNHLVIVHDIHIGSTTNVAKVFPSRKRKDGMYYAIDFTLKELKKLRVNERYNKTTGTTFYPKRFPYGESKFEIPTFEEFIELVRGLNKSTGRNIGMIPEIKHPEFHQREKKDIAAATVKVLEKYDLNRKDSNVIIQCFYPPTLKRLKSELGLKVPLVFLVAENDWMESSADYNYYKTEAGIKEISKYADILGPWIYQILKLDETGKVASTNLVAMAHKYNMKVIPYTHRIDELPPFVQDHKQLLELLFKDEKIDGIFSDFADTVIQFL